MRYNKFIHDFPLITARDIQTYVLDQMKDLNTDPVYVRCLKLPDTLKQRIDEELASYNLPKVSQFHIFKRRHFFKPLHDLRAVHVDHDNGELVHASIVIPVEGCAQTSMYWVDGEYEKGDKMEKLIHTNTGSTVRYQTLIWKTTPRVITSEEITSPTLCRVDIPHDACTGTNDQYRTVATLMLSTNPTFEEIINKRFGTE